MDNIQIRKKDTTFVLLITAILIGSCIFFSVTLFWGFLASILITSLLLVRRGLKPSSLKNMILQGVMECRNLYLLILLIGATVSIWLSSGVVPTMIYYGLEYMEGMNFLLAAFIITSLMAIFMGTAVGTISTIGLALLGIGKGFGVPEHVLLGAVISGAFIADKISPISGLLNLTLSVTKTKYRDVFKRMTATLVPVYLITTAIYYYLGKGYIASGNSGSLGEYQTAILKGFFVSPWLLILPIAIVALPIRGMKTISTISIGLLGGIIASISLQKMSVIAVLDAVFFGYKGTTASSQLNRILISGGVISMLEVVLIVAGAICLSSILEESGLIKPFIRKSIANIKSQKELVMKTGVISSLLTVVTCDQTVGILLPGRVFKEKYEEMKLSPTILARTISDTGTIIAPLMPWNVNALIIGMISGVSAVNYGPYAVLCYICPVVSFLSCYSYKKRSLTGDD
ncbi:Na+/H+ antiporter NhaC family protein [Alkaliphilus hydrothermalis]|uniref:NhaC family Na+:H+ antiporter n=1 Tax=Alkaliphilus hydrothermalis TaxID=1482730 RepID=A0ABS2NRD6_9FIRM|nr:Na+/H+ antiporter NhaC family protein [Alkaliphilus hydrothermalis]MBM7615529.1 NhaC family Na+:H+ antiporter [Alkaliphilus hydrothermalis]